MAYALGIDLGTTYTAAAIVRDRRSEIVTLGNRSAVVPSLVFLREDESILVGEAAERRGVTEPQRLAREFKRRVGDTTPIVLGPSPYSAERLSAQLLRWVVDAVTEREGGAPSHVAVAHPANWGEYKVDLLRQAVNLAGLAEATFLTEPVAAAIHYTATERVEPGETIAVYDLGGGTFDAAVLRRRVDGFEVLGHPEGIERLGGIDFDDAIVEHVRRALGERHHELEGDDPSSRSARARLRAECTSAKEALSTDTDTTINVGLPSGSVDVRLTRGEFEAMIRPPIRETIAALSRAIDNAGLAPSDLRAVLLVGGSSRIPLVAEMVSAELGRPVALDTHPKHAVALGAAHSAALEAAVPVPTATSDPATASEGDGAPSRTRPDRERRRGPVLVAAAVVAAALVAGALAFALGGDDGAEATDPTSDPTDATVPDETTVPTTAGTPECTTASGRCVFVESVEVSGDRYVVRYEPVGYEPLMAENGGSESDHHVHFFFDTVSVEQAGTQAPADERGQWFVWDLPSGGGEPVFDEALLDARGEATRMCAAVADASHAVDTSFSHCVDLPA